MRRFVLFLFLTSAIACHPGQPLAGGVKQPAGGTLTELTSNAHYDTTTAANGGYTILVPEGTYRIELELRAGESLEKHPADTRVHRSDIDAGRDFVVTVKP
jgi:hypothetical protein